MILRDLVATVCASGVYHLWVRQGGVGELNLRLCVIDTAKKRMSIRLVGRIEYGHIGEHRGSPAMCRCMYAMTAFKSDPQSTGCW